MYLKPNSPQAAEAGKSVIGFNIINGREVEGDLSLIQSKSAADSRDLVGMFPDSGEKDVARAAKAAAEAFRSWSATSDADRCAVVHRAAAILANHKAKLARIVTREVGMTGREALAEVQEAIDACLFYASEAPRPAGPAGACRRPSGVCGILATGSSPLAAPSRKILPAILTGNTVVWKPSDNAPTVAYLLLRALMEAGLPPGVVNTVNGRGRAGCGKHFLAGIEKGHFQAFSFVGSLALGRLVGEMCGRNLLLPSLDLAGRGTMVVLPDADLDQAAGDALQAAFGQAGQRVLGLGSLIVHESCAKGFKQRILDGLAAMEVGNPLTDPEAAYGPMINSRVATHFREHWDKGRLEGATLLVGGEQWTDANRTDRVKGVVSHGAYMQPCLWEGVTPDQSLFQQPVQGPALNFCVVPGLDEAIAWSNLAPCRVSGAIYTADAASLARFRTESAADLVLVNQAIPEAGALNPHAGLGTRPGGQPVLQGFTRWQAGAEPLPLQPIQAGTPLQTDWDSL